MDSQYDELTAFHYSAFRPSLHLPILNKCIEKGKLFTLGLDVGCGTGQSSIALTNYCKNVIGIEPSKEMLLKTIAHPCVEYLYYNKKHFSFPDDHFDIITFAGSLYYAKSQKLLDEVVRVTKRHATIIVYDFELLITDIRDKLISKSINKHKSQYDHEVNFDNQNVENIKILGKLKESASIEISASNLSHFMLSSKENYGLLLNSLGKEHLYSKLTQKLLSEFKNEKILVDTMIYSSIYKTIK